MHEVVAFASLFYTRLHHWVSIIVLGHVFNENLVIFSAFTEEIVRIRSRE